VREHARSCVEGLFSTSSRKWLVALKIRLERAVRQGFEPWVPFWGTTLLLRSCRRAIPNGGARCAGGITSLDKSRQVSCTQQKGISVKTGVEAAVMSIHENPDEGTARVNLRWEGNHQMSDFDVDKLGKVLDSEDETEHSGWALVERPVTVTVGKTVPLRSLRFD
jgi:hypothetical protein